MNKFFLIDKDFNNLKLKISYIDSEGNGIAFSSINKIDNIKFLIPGTLEDEIIIAKPMKNVKDGIYCELLEIISPSNLRVKEDCSQFLKCGGCDFRHVSNNWIQNWKINQLKQKTKRLVSPNKIFPIAISENYSRRRATFSAVFHNKKLFLGFKSKFSTKIVNLDTCKTLEKELIKIYLFFRDNLGSVIKIDFKFLIHINLLDKGSDIVFNLEKSSYDKIFEIDNLINLLTSAKILRISFKEKNGLVSIPLQSEIKNKLGILNNKTIYSFPPPGGFLQPTKNGEREIIKYVLNAVSGSKKIIDLFCGSGTLSIPMSQNATITCVDSNVSSLSSLNKSFEFYNTHKKNEVFHQNLLINPLSYNILKKMDAAVINPPENGAIKQIREIIKSSVKKVIYVSCNINSFVRDAIILLENDYELEWIKPVDQFPNTIHLEIVSKFNIVK